MSAGHAGGEGGVQESARPLIATVAALCGSYDQSHLTRDFVDLAGMPPGEWLAAEDLSPAS